MNEEISQKVEGMSYHHFDCFCSSAEHTIRFLLDTYEDSDDKLYVEVQLVHRNRFLMRVWFAIKYIFGYKCKYGHWDCMVFQKEDLPRLKEIVEKAMN